MLTAQEIVEGLVQRNVPRTAAIALVGNSVIESGLNPGINERNPLVEGSRGGFGLMQWTGPRRRQLEAYAGSKGRPVSDAETQLDFLTWELENTERAARNKIYSASTIEDAARAVSNSYLRPGIPHLNKRVDAAKRIAGGEQYADSGMIMSDAQPDNGSGNVLTRDPGVIERTYKAFVDGDMSPQERAAYEEDVRTGRMPIPTGMSIGEPINVEVAQIEDVYNRYQSGDMDDDQRAEYEADVRAGIMPLPNGVAVQFGQIAPAVEAAPVVDTAPTPAAVTPEPQEETGGAADMVGRQLGLTGRYLGQGAAGIAGIVQDPINYLISKALGTEQLPPLREQVSDAMTAQGVPQPETGMERIIGGASEAMVGAGAGAGIAAGVGRALGPGVAQNVANISAMAPAAQVMGGAGAGGAQQATAEAGGGPLAQTAAALAGGVVGSGVGSALTRADVPAPTPKPAQTMTPARAAAGITDDITTELPSMSREALGDIAFKAGRGNKAAQKKLAELARVDPAAADAARRLGIEMPADVFGLNTQIDEIAGMLRTQKGGELSKQWDETISTAAARAKEVMQGETQFPSLSDASTEIRRNLETSMTQLKTAAGEIYDDVGAKMPQGIRVKPNKTQTFINEYFGVRSENSPYIQPELKKLLKGLQSGDMSYADLNDARQSIGQSIGSFNGQFKDADQGMINKLYGLLADDQMAIVGATIGENSVEQLKKANQLTVAYKGLQDDIVLGFGRSENGSIASLMRSALTTAGRGDDKNLLTALKVIPKDLRKDTLIATLDELSKSGGTSTNKGEFSFAQFDSTWTKLKSQTPIMAAIRNELGAETFETMSDLASASKNIHRAHSQTQAAKKTGASLTAEVFVDGVMARMLNSPAGKTTFSMTGGVAAGAAASPFGTLAAVTAGAGANAFLSSIKFGGKKAATAAAFMNSPEFLKLATAASRNAELSERDISRAVNSSAFQRWAKVSGVSNPRAWLIGALTPQQAVEIQQIQQEQSNGN